VPTTTSTAPLVHRRGALRRISPSASPPSTIVGLLRFRVGFREVSQPDFLKFSQAKSASRLILLLLLAFDRNVTAGIFMFKENESCLCKQASIPTLAYVKCYTRKAAQETSFHRSHESIRVSDAGHATVTNPQP